MDDCCKRSGWSFVVYRGSGELEAAAHGRPPAWAKGIHGAELWALLMAAQSCMPTSPLWVDCESVRRGSQRGGTWATAPCRRLARAWGPLAAALEDRPERVGWMPAHCSAGQAGSHEKSDGSQLSLMDIMGNDVADRMAKEAAMKDAPPERALEAVRRAGRLLRAVARWIGQVTVLAGKFPLPAVPGEAPSFARDSEAVPLRRRPMARDGRRAAKRPAAQIAKQPGELYDLSGNARWEALRRRVQAREAAAAAAAGAGSSPAGR